MLARGHAWIRLAQLRGNAAQLYRGGQHDSAFRVLQQMITQDLQLGLTTDAALRARQAVALEHVNERVTPTALALYALTLLHADDRDGARQAASLAVDAAVDRAAPTEAAAAELIVGKIALLDGELDLARAALQRCRSAALDIGHVQLAALAFAELAAVETVAGRPAAAAVCWQFCATCYQKALAPQWYARALAMQVRSLLAAQRFDHAMQVAAQAHQAAAAVDDVVSAAIIDCEFADFLVEHQGITDDTRSACIIAVESASVATRDPAETSQMLLVLARMRLAVVTPEIADAQRHWDAGVDVARRLPAELRSDLLLHGVLLLRLFAPSYGGATALYAHGRAQMFQTCSAQAQAALLAIEASDDDA